MEKKRKEKGRKSAWKKVMLAVIIIPVLIATIALCAGMIILHTGDEEIDEGKLNFTSANLKITDNSGQYVDLPEKYDKFATSEEIPDILKKAFVALEDKRFYIHHGVDYLRVAKAAVNNIAAGGIKEGASTITQQLIKNTHLTAEKSFKRKLTEARLALKLEKQYSKDEILTMYLNMLYFGSGEYGVKNAAYRFFGKELSELNTAECAMLTGIVKSPTKYNPINNYYNSMERTDLVLNVMCKEGVISEYERDKAKNTDIIIKNQVFKNNSAFYFLEYSIKECCEIMNITPEQLLSGGFTVKTYLDVSAQNLLEKVMTNPALTLNDAGGDTPDCAAVVLDNSTSGVKAFYSNCDYSPSTKRQPGSALKPLVCYAPAFECGAAFPATIIDDCKKNFSGYSPDNYKDEYYGKVSVRECLMNSLNVPAVEVMNMVGVEQACSYLPKLNIELEESDYNFSTALGGMTYGTNITNLAAAYSVFTRGGMFTPHAFVSEIVNTSGKTIYKRAALPKRVFGADTSYLITDILQDTAKSGSAKKLAPLKFPIASKTGTVSASDPNYNTDVYNVSYTTSETAVFWQGNMSGKAEEMLPAAITGGGSPTLMARQYFSRSVSAKNAFVVPGNVKQLNIDSCAYAEGKVILADAAAPKYAVTSELFSLRHIPKERNRSYTDLHKPQIAVKRSGENLMIELQADPRLGYEIIRRDYFSGDGVVAAFYGGKDKYSFTESPVKNAVFAPRYVVKVFYTSEGGERISRTYPLDLRL